MRGWGRIHKAPPPPGYRVKSTMIGIKLVLARSGTLVWFAKVCSP